MGINAEVGIFPNQTPPFSSDTRTFMDGLLQISPMEMLTNTIASNSMETKRNGCFIAI